MNAVISDADTLEVFTAAAEQQEGPVVMLNLLKFKASSPVPSFLK